ncbi:MAG: LytTR family DNA-binding domain-containing protein [Candidatus Azobacteroides sp.]|nr:LytTR family DNA-binding domain-containing protein [Candidatus Azobacteroides sp.]
MKCIIVDDEPIARLGIKKLIQQFPELQLIDSFNNAEDAACFMETNPVDLVFLDIQMPGINGLEFAKTISGTTLIIFTTAYAEFAVDSYEVDAISYLVKPIDPVRFGKAIEKAISYHHLLVNEENKKKESIQCIGNEHIFVKSDRRFFKVSLKDILFIEGLKDYVIIQMEEQRIITHMSMKAIHEMLPQSIFLRVNRSYIVNKEKIDSFDNNDLFIKSYELAIGNFYREQFFEDFVKKK